MEPDPSTPLLAGGVVLCLLVLAFTSAVDAALTAINRRQLNVLQSEHASRASLVNHLLSQPYHFKATVLCLNAGAIMVATALTFRMASSLPPYWRFASLLPLLALILIFSEALPKALATRNPSVTAQLLARPMAFVTALLGPLIGLVDLITRPLIRLIVGSAAPRAPLVTEEELRLLMNVGEEEGLIEKDEREMIEGIFSFGDTLVREVMTPRMDIVALDVSAGLDQALDLSIARGHSRLPVYQETVDQVVGVLHIKDLLPALRDGRRSLLLTEVLRPAHFIPETMKVDVLLKDLQTRKTHIAIVVDEYGGTAGVVTIEDLLEEIVGEIQDEYDVAEPSAELVGEGELVADARISLDDINHMAGLRLVSEEADRIGGLVYEHLGRVPAVGDRIQLPDGVTITVVSVEGLGPRQLRITYPTAQTIEVSGPEGGGSNDNN